MTTKKRVSFALCALIVPTLLLVGYLKAKPLARRVAIRATVPLSFQLASGQPFPGLVAVTEDYAGNCTPTSGCAQPQPSGQRVVVMRADGTEAQQFWEYSP